MRERKVELDLAKANEHETSQLLHRLRLLGVAGFQRTGGTDFVERDELVETRESWSIRWSPEFDASLIEACRYGVNQLDATSARLEERIAQARQDAEKMALALLDAGLAGLDVYAATLLEAAAGAVRTEAQFLRRAGARSPAVSVPA